MENLYDEVCEKYPRLDLGQRVGRTEYIDFILPDELTAPVMRGVDCLQRKFICIRIILSNGRKVATTFFQRHANNSDYWVSARLTDDTEDRNPFMSTVSDGVSKEQFFFLYEILSGKEIQLSEEMYKKYRLDLPLKGNFDQTIKLDL